jgi:monofunctional biosynthetic peptidoglycan transglycosylase
MLRIVLVLALLPVPVLFLYRYVPPPLTPLMVIRLFEGEGLRKDWVPLEDIAPALPLAAVAAEDNLFCTHWGFDTGSLSEQMDKFLAGKRSRGASTISMQLAKNLFLWPGRNIIRKLLELPLTVLTETMLSKRRIMELYLNTIEFGHGIYGAEAAAQAHFSTKAAALSDRQASVLAAVLPNPRTMSAANPSAYVLGRAAIYRERILALGDPAFA